MIIAYTLDQSAIFSSYGKGEAPPIQPVLQCVQVRPLAGQQGTPDRFRVVFSDINNFVQSMLATRTSQKLCRATKGPSMP